MGARKISNHETSSHRSIPSGNTLCFNREWKRSSWGNSPIHKSHVITHDAKSISDRREVEQVAAYEETNRVKQLSVCIIQLASTAQRYDSDKARITEKSLSKPPPDGELRPERLHKRPLPIGLDRKLAAQCSNAFRRDIQPELLPLPNDVVGKRRESIINYR